MGTVFSFAIYDPGDWTEPLAEAVAWLRRVDSVFSTYRADSEISRIRAGGTSTDPLVAEVLELCEAYEELTEGAFTAQLPSGLDPSGLVKGWAVERASDILRAHGSSNHGVNGGGDMQLAGEPEPGRAWRIGITDPFDASRAITTIEGRDCAIATSGTAERGPHIIDPRTSEAVGHLASVTVIGPSLCEVDVAATAAFVHGPYALRWLRRQGLRGLAVTRDRQLWDSERHRHASRRR